jgi:peptidoglycan/LPS O-acetylase OafA/YrhL
VLVVVLYHLWPARLPGGFVGVDIFFAISGFLITGHLMREVDKTGRVRLGQFWARRARRLLPASLTVLVVTAVTVLVAVPQSLWQQFLRAVVGSVLYVQNWVLASDSVDYLAADNIETPVQHFWSLGVEEQFYVAWPLLIALALLLTRGGSIAVRRRAVLGLLVLVFVVSLGLSVWLTATDPASAYFVTHTRAWEFAAGGILAIVAPEVVRANDRARTLLAWLGWGMITVAVLTFTGATPFPSYTALLPVVGSLLVISAGSPDGRWSPTPLAEFGPVRLLGDVSYSLYLWHWPLIVLTPFVLGRDLDTGIKVVILALAIALAWLSKVVIEDPARTAKALTRRRPGWTFGAMAAGMVLALIVPAVGIVQARAVAAESARETQSLLAGGVECFGAAAFAGDGDCVNPELGDTLVPATAAVFDDTGGAFDCYRPQGSPDLSPCHFGSDSADAPRVAIVGDSHAAMLVPGLAEQVDELGWSLDVYVGWGGSWVDPSTVSAGPQRQYSTAVDTALQGGDYDVVLATARRDPAESASTTDRRVAATETVFRQAREAGTRVVVVRDNPTITQDALDCVTQAPAGSDTGSCAVTQQDGYAGTDDLVQAAQATGSDIVDLGAYFCRDDSCPIVIGNVIVYRDQHHITATFSKTLAPYLVQRVQALVSS